MRRIIANYERLHQVVINDVCTKPCRPDCSTEADRFQRDHRFLVSLYADDGSSQGNQMFLCRLTCWYVNADSTEDVKLCRGFGLSGVLDCVRDAGYAVDNLAIVTGAEFSENATYADLNLAFTKLYCIMCSVMHNAFGSNGNDRKSAIYFDFGMMPYVVSKFLKSFISEYKDGDVSRENIGDGAACYVHKIPWVSEV